MDYTEVILAVIGLCTTVVTVIVVPWIKSKIDNEKLQKNIALIDQYVKAAEQLLGAKTGEEKKNLVISLLKSKGVVVDENMEAIIEASVYSLGKIADAVTEEISK